MCVALPCRLIERSGVEGVAELGGTRVRVRLDLVEEARVGDYVLVHAGFAISTVDEATAAETLELLSSLEP
jgi:hydrogenase expression/formation protein HypC